MKYIANPVTVEARRIVAVGDLEYLVSSGGAIRRLRLEDEPGVWGAHIIATEEMMARWEPKVGDYVVTQEDGYIYGNPKHVFERKYAPLDGERSFPFGWAIEMMRLGHKVARRGWNGKGMFLYFVGPASYPPQTAVATKEWLGGPVPYAAYVAMKSADGTVFPWTPNMLDTLATDWQLVL